MENFDPFTAFAPPEEPMPKKKKWWIPVVAVLGILATATLIFAVVLSMNKPVKPVQKLAMAMQKTEEALLHRLDGSPLTMLSKYVGKNTRTVFNITKEWDEAKSDGDYTLLSDLDARRFSLSRKECSIYRNEAPAYFHSDYYLDASNFAMRYDDLNDGQWFGLQLESFYEDVMNNPNAERAQSEDEILQEHQLLMDMLSQALKSRPQNKDILKPYIHVFSRQLSAMEMVEGESDFNHDDTSYHCQTVSFQITRAHMTAALREIIELLEKDEELKQLYLSADAEDDTAWNALLEDLRTQLADMESSMTGGIHVTCYLYGELVIGIEADVLYETSKKGTTDVDLTVSFGPDPSKGNFYINAVLPFSSQKQLNYGLRSYLVEENGTYSHKLEIDSYDQKYHDINFRMNTTWTKNSGVLSVDISNYYYSDRRPGHFQPGYITDKFSQNIILKEEGNAFWISYSDSFLVNGEIDGYYTEYFSVKLDLHCMPTEESVESQSYLHLKEWDRELADDYYYHLHWKYR